MNIKPIKSEKDYNEALTRLETVFHAEADTPEGDEAEVLSILIEKYEAEHFPIEKPTLKEAVKFRKEQMRIIQFLIIACTISFSQTGFCQKFIDDIHIGEPMPDKILIGGYTEIEGKNPSARNFLIEYDLPAYESSGKRGCAISIFEQNDTVVAIMKITGRASYLDALQTYIYYLSYFTNTINHFPNRKLITARHANGTVPDGNYYYVYSEESGREYYATGVIGDQIVEEFYIRGSNYDNVLKN